VVVNILSKLREDVSTEDLAYLTNFLHRHKPETKDRLVIGIQKPQPGDKNVKFVMMTRSKEVEKEFSTVMIAAEWILDMLGDNLS
jgi:peptidyl-tRNA hydrolase